jgi:imidazolonepropionase-like amidohydrolase
MRSATAHAAELLDTKDRGRLAPGLLADVVAFGGDPSTNIALLEKPPQLIILAGRRIERTALGVA